MRTTSSSVGEAAVAQVEQIAAVATGTGLDASQHLLFAAVVAVGWHQQPTQRVARALVVVPVQMGSEPAAHLGQVVEAMHVEQLLGQVGVDVAFAPSEADVAWSQRIIAAHAEAAAAGQGVVLVEGKLIENLHVANARRTVQLAAAIAALAAG